MAELAELGSLENLLSPFCYGDETPWPPSSPGHPKIPYDFHFSQFLSQDCQWGCVYNKSLIKCYPVDSRLGEGGVRGQVPVAVSTDTYQFPGHIFISCVTELMTHNQRISSGLSKLLLGLNVNNQAGALVLFDPIRAQPLKWISLPAPATSLAVLSHFEEGGSNRPFFNEAMMAMVGIAAVGMQGGQVLIVDLGLDDPNLNIFHNHHRSHRPFDSGNGSSVEAFHLLFVDPHESIVATKRHHAVAKKDLICLSVMNEAEDVEMNDEDFHYCKPNGETMMIFKKQRTSVTCVEYIPAIGSLVVGFGFGCFQIWRVDNLNLIFSSNMSSSEERHQIFGFSFIQPIDDPKNYCYLWVLYGRRGQELSHSHVELHCLNFEEKPFVEGFGYTYDELRQCVRRLSFKLEDYFDDDNPEEEGDLRYQVRPLRIWAQPENNLTFFSWESRRIGLYYIGIFDLNQWYSNHTLEFIRYNPLTGLCPYFVAIPVEAPSPVGDVRLIPKTLERWENPHMKLDIHLFPASLSFQAVSVTSTGVGPFQHFGLQEKLIRKLLSDGASLMMQPSNIRRTFKTYGLQPVFPLRYDSDMSQEDADRYYIFSVLLESRRNSIIIQFAAIWLDGSYTNVGCTVDLILDWIASYTKAVRVMATEHWENLFSFKNEILPPETPHFINYSNFLWNSLHGVLTTIMRPDEVYSVRGNYIEDLEHGLSKLLQYSAALLMIHRAGMLPERDDMDFLSALVTNHEDRRQDVKNALYECSFLEPSLRNIRPMMIDYLLEPFDEDFVREQWHVAPEDELYPPRHIGYVLNMFIWGDHEKPKDIARVIAYFLFDICSLAKEKDEAKLRGDFLSVLKLSSEEQNDVYNLWLLDQGNVHEPLMLLSQKDLLCESDQQTPWNAVVVVCTALGNDEDVLEILQKSCPVKLRSLYMNLMAKSPIQYKSLCDSICSQTWVQQEEMLTNFFQLSAEKSCLTEFIRTYIRCAPSSVVGALVEFLQSYRSFENDDRLLLIYIYLEDYKNLEELYERMKKQYEGKLGDDQRKHWIRKACLVKYHLGKKKNTVLDFLHSSPPKIVFQSKPSLKIKVQKVGTRTDDIEDQEGIGLPPQLRRLKILQSKSSDPLSPLRRYAGKLHTVISTPNPSSPASDGIDRSPSSPNDSMASISELERAGEHNVTKSLLQHDVYSEGRGRRCDELGGNGDETLSRTSKYNSPVNLQRLLRIPTVDHRVSRRSISFLAATPTPRRRDEIVEGEANTSLYFTPGPVTPLANGDGDFEVHSIMKKEDSVSRRREKIRFLDLSDRSFESDISEGVSSENVDLRTMSPIENQAEDMNNEEGKEVTINQSIKLNTREEEHKAGTESDVPTELVRDTGIGVPAPPLIDQMASSNKQDMKREGKRKRDLNTSEDETAPESESEILTQPSTMPHLEAEVAQVKNLKKHDVKKEGKKKRKPKSTEEIPTLELQSATEISQTVSIKRVNTVTPPQSDQLISLNKEESKDLPTSHKRRLKISEEEITPVTVSEASEEKAASRKRVGTRRARTISPKGSPAMTLIKQEGKRTRKVKTTPESDSSSKRTDIDKITPQEGDKSISFNSEDGKKDGKRKRKLNTSVEEQTPESDTSSVFETSVEIGPRTRQRSTRSMTPTLLTFPSVDEDNALDISGHSSTGGVKTRSRRTSKTKPATENPDTSSIFETSMDTGPSTRRRSTRSKTPTLQTMPPLDEEKVVEILSASPTSTGVTTRSKSMTPSPTKIEKTGDHGNEGAKDSIKKGRRRGRHIEVFGFCPDLSTVLEDSSVELSILEKTIEPTPLAPTSSVPKSKSRKKSSQGEEKDETEVKPRKRIRKSIAPEEDLFEESVMDDDDAKSDISVRSTRSNRSTASTSSKKATRSRRNKSSQE